MPTIAPAPAPRLCAEVRTASPATQYIADPVATATPTPAPTSGVTATPAPQITPQPQAQEGQAQPAPTPTDPTAAAQAAVAGAQNFYTRYGLGAAQGNGPVQVVFDTSADGFTAYLADSDRIRVANNPISGKNEAFASDIIAHEYTHRILERLVPGITGAKGEPGVLNEAIADTLASVIEGRNWTIGEDVIDGGGRNLATGEQIDKTDDGRWIMRAQPIHMSNFDRTDRDNGGVHVNMGIPGHAAYLMGEAIGRQALGDVYMTALTRGYVTAQTTIAGFADATVHAANDLYGANSSQSQAVAGAWAAVGALQPAADPGAAIAATGNQGFLNIS